MGPQSWPPQIVPGWHCHDRFYFSDGSLHLLVEDSLYCVHRSLFEIHANKFPVSGIDASFGDPYTLKDVKQIDFDRLLACLYPQTLLVEEPKTSEEWTSILKLASKWGFESLQSRAIREFKRTLNTPVEMVAFGRQYDIPDILLPGYATLCQSNVPLTYEEGLHLGMKDVVDIYRIRHELHGFDITVVSFEEATAKVKAFISNEGRRDDAEAGTAEQRNADLDDEQASVWTDVGSVSSSRAPSTGNDRELEAAVSMASTDRPPGVEKLGGSGSEHRSPNEPSQSDASGSQGGDTQLTLQHIPNRPGLTIQGLMAKFLDRLTMDNFDALSVKILGWVNANDSQALYHVTRLIVEKAVNNHGQTDVCVHLCKEMAKKVSGKIRDTIIKDTKSTVFNGVWLFRGYLGEVCQKILEGVGTSVTAADTCSDEINLDSLQDATLPEVRRWRLIRFISKVSNLTSKIIMSPAIVKKWITTLFDAENEEKLVTLSMLLDSAGPHWDASGKLKAFMNSHFVEMTIIAQRMHKARVRTLLQDVIERRNKGWVVNETTQQRRGLAEKRRASCSSEDELANEQPEVETVKTSKLELEGSGKRSGKRDMMLASLDEEPLDDERDWFAVTGNRLRSLGPVGLRY
ncbi:hypothetical protein M378DRAFT_172664 [Amanita muscaria Koide BX008]|uniref:MIF4G domain-containing protein n=1 Tax=Amanita muscaria (strain Koide BX008) TaxID=946122 RepID=A0A0C2W5X1_AMAMK|nr:hypothetical protein M378DRAFT_172664 [Amanita muscaria Koide BX008]